MKLCQHPLTVLSLVVIIASVAVGCVSPSPPPFTSDFYSPLKITALSESFPTMSVYQFIDERPSGPKFVYRFDSISSQFGESSWSKIVNAVQATEPVAVGVTHAVLEGLRARGFSVIDMTATSFDPGGYSGDARIVISGRILAFGVQVVRSGLYEYRTITGCKIVLKASDLKSGRKLWEKSYARQEETMSRTLASTTPSNNWPNLSKVLAAVIEEAVSDPALLKSLRGG